MRRVSIGNVVKRRNGDLLPIMLVHFGIERHLHGLHDDGQLLRICLFRRIRFEKRFLRR